MLHHNPAQRVRAFNDLDKENPGGVHGTIKGKSAKTPGVKSAMRPRLLADKTNKTPHPNRMKGDGGGDGMTVKKTAKKTVKRDKVVDFKTPMNSTVIHSVNDPVEQETFTTNTNDTANRVSTPVIDESQEVEYGPPSAEIEEFERPEWALDYRTMDLGGVMDNMLWMSIGRDRQVDKEEDLVVSSPAMFEDMAMWDMPSSRSRPPSSLNRLSRQAAKPLPKVRPIERRVF